MTPHKSVCLLAGGDKSAVRDTVLYVRPSGQKWSTGPSFRCLEDTSESSHGTDGETKTESRGPSSVSREVSLARVSTTTHPKLGLRGIMKDHGQEVVCDLLRQ